MQLLEDFAFVNDDGTSWPAGSGRHIDGASLPQALWSILGGPCEGKYRRA